MSSLTVYLAKLFGLYLIAISIIMFAHPQATVLTMEAMIQNRPLLFFAGIIGVTAGLAIVLAHNVWSGGALPIIVTLFGWISLIKSMTLLLLSPENESRIFIVGIHYDQFPDVYAAFLLLLGAYLTYAGFTAGQQPASSSHS